MAAKFSSISPICGNIVWSGLESTPVEIDSAMNRAAKAASSWRNSSVQQRIQIARNYRDQLESGRDEITDLIVREVGKMPGEATAEVNASIAKIDLSIQALAERRSNSSIAGDGSIVRRTIYQPLGVVTVLGPFNFPLHLPGGQIIPALLAGNAVVFKPSEQATAIGQWMVQAWQAAGLPSEVLQLVLGGPQVAVRAIDSQHTSAVFLTGSRAAGRAIHQRLAGRPEVLLALELGGNNPIVIAPDAPEDAVGSIVTASAFVTAGQRCTCTRRAIFVESAATEKQLQRLVQRTRALHLGMPGDTPQPDVGPLISITAAETLMATYDQLLSLGCQSMIPLEVDPRAKNLIHPTIVDASGLTMSQWEQLGQMEWFGPLLVVQRTADFEAAIRAAAITPYGLAAALLGGTKSMFDQFVCEVRAGVVNWNGTTTGAAGSLPFGGLGDSGNHRPAGFFMIDSCNDPIAIIERTNPPTDDPWNQLQ